MKSYKESQIKKRLKQYCFGHSQGTRDWKVPQVLEERHVKTTHLVEHYFLEVIVALWILHKI